MMVTPINRFSGLASGMDIDSIVKGLMMAHRKPLDVLKQKKQLIEWQREDYRDMNTKLWDYRNNKLFNFKLEGNLSSRTATSANADIITAKATGDAQIGQLNIKVNNVATAATNRSASDIRANSSFDPTKTLASQAANLAGTLTQVTPATNPPTYETYEIKINGSNVITIDPNVDSLNDVIARINANTNVTSFYEVGSTGGLVSFTSKQTGKVNGANKDSANITFENVKGNFTTDILKITGAGTAATDASVDINGVTGITKKSNTFTINGVELTLNPLTPAGSSTTVTVKTDTDKMVESIKGFINDYNEILKTMQDKINESRFQGYPPLSDEQKKEMKDSDIELWTKRARSGLLRNDSYLSQAVSGMRMAIMAQVETGSKDYKTLSSIGIETGQYVENGKLYLTDENKLRKAIEENPDAVIAMFTANGNGDADQSDVGIAERIYDQLKITLDGLTSRAGTAVSLSDNSVLGKRLYEMDKEIDKWNVRLNEIENRYYRQFTAMESAISRYNSQSLYLANAFGGA
ncbi:flagellar filament capping protein FliD [Paenibacillus naphthalenovorans]|uniref:Flagellar hook-associated protein 2 n=1 Tax=Paenibacillus naphthalenovorans TaxID=162209 RepID=A0A0U2WAG5_9BACL|nr:flagellar filament capping protein FliD [Paenibacillus naphthalenovorans]ALS24469.1 flagellar hook-associated 2 domain-containing protein [Paenibacillus naphthalenovorans]GCL73688.1 hypothetical protein PN4B1_36290 [Paenibacillus naphthalenovorans]